MLNKGKNGTYIKLKNLHFHIIEIITFKVVTFECTADENIIKQAS